jgi:hypothetical protein
MNIFEINERTETDIVSFGELNLATMASILIKRNLLDDAKLVLQHVDTKISCRNRHMIQWLYTHNLLEFTSEDISYICKNAQKKEFLIVKELISDIQPYLQDCAHHPHFFKWVFKYVSHIETPVYTSNLSLLQFLTYHQTFDIAYINKVCVDGNLASFKYLIKLTSTNPNKFHKTALINNSSHFFEYLKINHISKYTYVNCLRSKAYDSIRLSHKLNPNLFTKEEHTDIFKRILCYNEHIPYDFFVWYKSLSNPVNVSVALCKSGNTFLLKSFYKIHKRKHFFIAAQYDNLSLIKLLIKKNDFLTIMEALVISCIDGNKSVAKYLCDFLDIDEYIYLVLYKMIAFNSQHDNIIRILFEKNKTVYPSLMPIYSITNKQTFPWIKDNLHIFLKESDNYYNTFQYYVNLTCHYGNDKLFLKLSQFIQEEQVYQYFINACSSKKGLFIANYLLYTYPISSKTIEMAFYNTDDIDVIKWLYNSDIDIRKNNDHYFLFSCLNNHIEVVIWLMSICPDYSCTIENGHIVDYFVSISKVIQSDLSLDSDCNICLSVESNCKTKCNHEYCYDCINTWYSKNTTCPMCRDKIDMVYVTQP